MGACLFYQMMKALGTIVAGINDDPGAAGVLLDCVSINVLEAGNGEGLLDAVYPAHDCSLLPFLGVKVFVVCARLITSESEVYNGVPMTSDKNEILLTTLEAPPGYRVLRVLGLVSASTAWARHLGRDITATIRNILGGEVKEYTELLAKARGEALRRLEDRARERGANAVLGLRIVTSMITYGAAEVLAYGTAAIVEREEASD